MDDSLGSVNVDSGNETDEKIGKAIECSDMCDEFLDSENFQFDGDTNQTGSEDDIPAHILSSCTDENIKSLDSISSSSIEQSTNNIRGPPDIDEECDVHVNDANQSFDFVDSVCGDTEDLNFQLSFDKFTNLTSDSISTTLSEHNDFSKNVGSCIENVIEEESVPVDIPNGITKTILSKEYKSSHPTRHNAYSTKKFKKILTALESGDTEFLRNAAVSRGGLLNDEIRKKVWPKLLGVDMVETSPRPCLKEIEAHPYYGQVVLDVNRSLKRFPPSIKEAQRLTMLDQLVFLIMRVLCKHPEMHYYQGYHDICVTFLLVLGEETAFHVVEKLSRTHLNVFMEKNMEPTIHLLEYMYVLIGKKNPLLKNFLLKSEVGVAYCLSWLITWFGHVLNDYDNVVRLFDFFIVSHPWMPVYLTTAVVLHRELEILKQDCEMAAVHSLLSHIPDDLPFEELIVHSLNLHESYEPKLLAIEHPYVKRNKLKPKKEWRLLQTVTRKIKSAVPATPITLPIVLAAAFLVTAIIYQAYKY